MKIITILFGLVVNSYVVASSITNLNQLNYEIDNGDIKTVGFLSTGNYHTVQNELHDSVVPLYFEHVEDLEVAVETGEVLAGLVSGTPNHNSFNTFGSEQISVRAMFVNSNRTKLLNALDAAIVRVIEKGVVEKIAENNKPYEALVVHSCKPSQSHFDWPNLENNTVIKIASLGPYDWGGSDGDYTKKPYVGFWPDYYNVIENEFRQQYNITFERVWYKTSGEVLDSVANGITDTTEPYMMVGASYQEFSRKSMFAMTCITSATQDKYFTLKYFDYAEESYLLHFTWILAFLAFFSILLVSAMYVRERRGNPLFAVALIEKNKGSTVVDVPTTGVATGNPIVNI